jgi:uncharacterized protein (TIGR03435 family)
MAFNGRIGLSLACSGALCFTTWAAQAQVPPGTKPAFEVASVRPNKSGAQNASIRIEPGGRLTGTNQTVRNLVRNAWNLQPFQIVGGPDWIDSDHFDIFAKVAESELNADGRLPPDQLMLRVQALLEDRFRLVTHQETRELPVYALVVARADGKLGPKLNRHTGACTDTGRGSNGPPATVAQNCGTRMNMAPTLAKMTGLGISMATFARNLSGGTGRYVVDKTQLAGVYDLELQFTPEQSADTSGASLFTAMQEQLGLKLEAQRAPVPVLVIDSASQPTPD